MSTSLCNSVKILLTFILMSQTHISYSKNRRQDPPLRKDSSTHVVLNSRILVNAKKTIGSYKLEVLYRDMVINSMSVKNNAPVRLLLKKDAPYVLKISKKGYIPRYIYVNTNMREKTTKNFYYLTMQTDLISSSEARILDDEALQLPSALVSYNKKAGVFESNKDYYAFVQRKLFGGDEVSAMLLKD